MLETESLVGGSRGQREPPPDRQAPSARAPCFERPLCGPPPSPSGEGLFVAPVHCSRRIPLSRTPCPPRPRCHAAAGRSAIIGRPSLRPSPHQRHLRLRGPAPDRLTGLQGIEHACGGSGSGGPSARWQHMCLAHPLCNVVCGPRHQRRGRAEPTPSTDPKVKLLLGLYATCTAGAVGCLPPPPPPQPAPPLGQHSGGRTVHCSHALLKVGSAGPISHDGQVDRSTRCAHIHVGPERAQRPTVS